jgi:hypothetical protein
MAIEFDIQVRNGRVRITVGGSSAGKPNTQGANGGSGKNFGTGPGGSGANFGTGPGGSGTNFGTGPGGDETGSDCCCPVVIGPIVISGDAFANSDGSKGGSGTNFGTGPGGDGKNFGTGPGGDGKNFGTGPGGGGKNFGTGPGGSGPVIIGPIVISGCGSGQDPASSDGSDGDTESTAVTVNPPQQVHSDPNMARSFIMQTQMESFWCWAAVAVSVNDFLDAPPATAGPAWTQPTLATELFKQQGVTTADCSKTPGSDACNQPEALDAALQITGNLMPNGALARQHLTFESIQNWVNVQLPLAARIKWRGDGAHFVVLDGCKVLNTGQQMVHVQDPASTTVTAPGFWDYDAFVENYEEAGFWVDTYLLTANKS